MRHADYDEDWTYAYDLAPTGGKMSATILLADDDDALRQSLAGALRRDGHVVMEAEDGEQLLEGIASHVVYPKDKGGLDLIVSDVIMPAASGLWVLATLRELDWATPFVVMSDMDNPHVEAEAYRLGAAAFLPKPFSVGYFREVVRRIVVPEFAPHALVAD